MDGVRASLAPALAHRPTVHRVAEADEEELMRAVAAIDRACACAAPSPGAVRMERADDEDDVCCICLEPLGSSRWRCERCCKDTHADCFDAWRAFKGSTCPMCRHVECSESESGTCCLILLGLVTAACTQSLWEHAKLL